MDLDETTFSALKKKGPFSFFFFSSSLLTNRFDKKPFADAQFVHRAGTTFSGRKMNTSHTLADSSSAAVVLISTASPPAPDNGSTKVIVKRLVTSTGIPHGRILETK